RFNIGEGYLRVVRDLMKTNGVVLMSPLCQCRQVQGELRVIEPNVGVVQGDSLSLYLFVLFIDDVAEHLKSKCPDVECVLYADDIAILSKSQATLKKALVALSEWSRANRLTVNAGKTKVL